MPDAGLFNLSGRVALISGSSRGIGFACAQEMAKLGAKVVITSRKAANCEAAAQSITDAGGEAIAVPANVTVKPELGALVEQTIGHFGKIDILVCNAATSLHMGPQATTTDEAYEKMVATNVRSTFWLTNLVTPHMIAAKKGSIIMLSSIAGLAGQAILGIYGMTKAADAQLARNLAVELAPHGIRANAIAPGIVKTDFAKTLYGNEQILSATLRSTPLKRIAEPREIAGVACFLASDAASYLTGQTLVVDGGAMVHDVFV